MNKFQSFFKAPLSIDNDLVNQRFHFFKAAKKSTLEDSVPAFGFFLGKHFSQRIESLYPMGFVGPFRERKEMKTLLEKGIHNHIGHFYNGKFLHKKMGKFELRVQMVGFLNQYPKTDFNLLNESVGVKAHYRIVAMSQGAEWIWNNFLEERRKLYREYTLMNQIKPKPPALPKKFKPVIKLDFNDLIPIVESNNAPQFQISL